MVALRVLALALVGLAFGLIDDWPAITVMSLSLLVVIVLSFVWSRTSLTGLSFARRLSSSRVQVGDQLREDLSIGNASIIGKLFVEIEDRSTAPGHHADRVVNLGPRSARHWRVSSIARHRGRHQLGPVTLRSGDPFGLFRTQRRLQNALELTIYPLTVDLAPYVPGSVLQSGGGIVQHRSPHPTTTVGSIREYMQGDSINRVSWSATARAGRLMVKEFENDPTADVWIVLDLCEPHRASFGYGNGMFRPDDPLGWLDTELEYRIMLASSVARRSLYLGRSVGLMVNTMPPIVLPAERSDRQLLRILELLSDVDVRREPPIVELLTAQASRFRRDNVLLIATSIADLDLITWLASLRNRRILSEVMYVDSEMYPDSGTVEFMTGLRRERIAGYRMTRADHPVQQLQESAELLGFVTNGHRAC